MARRPELFCLLVAFIVTLAGKYGSSFKSKPAIQPAKQPQYLFPPGSAVVDSPRGSLLPLIQTLNEEQFVVVLYYAPWCSKSQAARAEYLKAGQYFKGKVTFTSVNCWWPEGDCKKRNKFLMFPVVMVYISRLDGYRFSDVMRAEKIVSFVESLLQPVDLLHSVEDTMNTLAKHETVVLGHFNMTSINQMASYRQFYYAAMRVIEKDSIQPSRFAALSSPLIAKHFNMFHFEDIVLLRLHKASLRYPFPNNITSSNLVKWAIFNKGQLSVTRLSPEGMKSRNLADNINKGPALIMFHTENPLFQQESGLNVLKTVALNFRRCMLQPSMNGVLEAWPRLVRDESRKYQQASHICQTFRHQNATVSSFHCCFSADVNPLKNERKICSMCCPTTIGCGTLSQRLLSVLKTVQKNPDHNCHNTVLSYSTADIWNVCCQPHKVSHQNSPLLGLSGSRCSDSFSHCDQSQDSQSHLDSIYFPTASFERHSTDRYVRDHLENLPRRLCSKLSLERQQNLRSTWTSDLSTQLDSAETKSSLHMFSNVGCQSNKSLNFFSIDAQNHWMFSDNLALPVNVKNSAPTAVLFDKQNEEHYIMEKNFTVSNTMSFILDFEMGRLKRHIQSHSFKDVACDERGNVCLTELNASNFDPFVHEDAKDVVVLIYAHWCGFCQTLSHTFLALANYFAASSHITFARVNGATNDLPWHYSFDTFPVVIFFPAHRKADSVVFSQAKAKTLVNLIHFVIKHSTYDTKLDLAADVCAMPCIETNRRTAEILLKNLLLKEARLQQKAITFLPSNVGTGSTQEEKATKDSGTIAMTAEHINQQLARVQKKIENVKKLIRYLEDRKEVTKKTLSDLYSDNGYS